MIRLADFEVVMLPSAELTSIAAAPFIVAALIASAGVIFIFMQASDNMNDMFPLGEEPGL